MKLNKRFLCIIIPLCFLMNPQGLANEFTKDQFPGYSLDLRLPAIPGKKFKGLKAGFAEVNITPTSFDTMIAHKGNAHNPSPAGDSFIDRNQNGKLDPVYLAGYHNNRIASGVHDALFTQAVVLDDGSLRIALISMDLLGMFNDEVLKIRKAVPQKLNIDHVIVHATHTHSAPDILGLWGKDPTQTGIDPHYRDFVIQMTVRAIEHAVMNLKETSVHQLAINNELIDSLIFDSRPPYVKDSTIRVLHFKEMQSLQTQGTLIFWANHPETVGDQNTLITADYVGYLRRYLKEGLPKKRHQGLGGTVLFFNGAIGGLLTPIDAKVPHPVTGKPLVEPSYEKADAIGWHLADQVFKHWPLAHPIPQPFLKLRAKTIALRLDHPGLVHLNVTGVYQRSWLREKTIRSEIDVFSLGNAVKILTVPGELYPEISLGGITNPKPSDFDINPVEVPSLDCLMGKGSMNMIIGLANDMIGYIIPKSEWYSYVDLDENYGEQVSLGPETAPTLYYAIRDLLGNNFDCLPHPPPDLPK